MNAVIAALLSDFPHPPLGTNTHATRSCGSREDGAILVRVVQSESSTNEKVLYPRRLEAAVVALASFGTRLAEDVEWRPPSQPVCVFK